MSSSKPEPPKESATRGPAVASKTPAKAGQTDRLAAALRNNLKRRKAQARARREPGPGGHEG